MDYDRNVYILGAGFSRDAGIPMIAQFMFVMRDCIPWLKSQSRNGEAAAVERVFEFRRQAASAAERVNLNAENVEELFSLASATNNPELSKDVTVAIAATIDFAATRDPHDESVVGIAQGTAIHEQWEVQHQQNTYQLRNGQIARRYVVPTYDVCHLVMAGYPEEWSEERSDTIITFNYDLLPEASLSRLQIPFNYGIPQSGIYQHDSAQMLRLSQSDRVLKVLKLHGSVNCALEASTNPRVFVYGDHDALRQAGDTPLLLPPTWRKDITGSLSSVWDAAVLALRSATRVVIIGYSIPVTDQHFKYLLAAGLQGNISLRSILFINPDPNREAIEHRVFDLFVRRADPNIVRILPHTSKDFLLSLSSQSDEPQWFISLATQRVAYASTLRREHALTDATQMLRYSGVSTRRRFRCSAAKCLSFRVNLSRRALVLSIGHDRPGLTNTIWNKAGINTRGVVARASAERHGSHPTGATKQLSRLVSVSFDGRGSHYGVTVRRGLP